MHIVNQVTNASAPGCPASGCLAVVGVMFELAEEGEAAESITELAKIFDRMGLNENVRCDTAADCKRLRCSSGLAVLRVGGCSH
jgi:hypothetical protein